MVMGLIGTMLVVAGGTLAGAATPGDEGRFWAVPTIPVRPTIGLLPALALFYGGMIGLVRSWLRLRRQVLTHGSSALAVVAVATVWALPLLVGPALGSRDVYAYAAQGELAAQGFDVYEQGPSALGDHPVLDPVDPLYLDSPVLYGPLFVEISARLVGVADGPVGTVFAFRALAVLGLAIAAGAVWDLAGSLGRDRVDALVLVVANPLMLLHLVSGAHNEALMLAFLVSGVAVERRAARSAGSKATLLRFVAITLCVVAAAIKVPAALAVAFVGWPWVLEADAFGRRLLRFVSVAVWSLGLMTAIGAVTGWGWRWLQAMADARPVDAYLSITSIIGVGANLVLGVDVDNALSVARFVGLVLAATIAAVLLFGQRTTVAVSLGWALVVVALLHPTTQPWYLTWGLMLMAASSASSRNRTFVGVSAFAAFVVLPVGPQLGQVLIDNSGRASIAILMAGLAVLTFSPASTSPWHRPHALDVGLVSVVVPTRNEGPNVAPLVERLAAALPESDLEVLFVDDSDTSATIEAVERVAATHGADRRLRVQGLHRSPATRWGGLGGAVVDGLALASGSVAVVMDGDLQHPPETVGALLSEIDGGAGIAVASRRVAGGADNGLSPFRQRVSMMAARAGHVIFPQRLGRVRDPLSGFFALRLDEVDVGLLHPDGFKILVEVLVTHPDLAVREVGFEFVTRAEGVSKASAVQGARYLGHLVDLRLRTSKAWGGAVGPQRIFRSG